MRFIKRRKKNETKYSNGRTRNTTKHRKHSKNMRNNRTKLHLVHPLGFKIDEKSIKRAGLDYWDKLEIEEHDSLEKFLEKYNPEKNNMFFATTKRENKIHRYRLF